MFIPFVDLQAQYKSIQTEIDEVIHKVINNQSFIRGKFVKEFESNFAEFCNAEYCTGVGNGTDALYIALKAIGVTNGDEVIIPANSFIATSEAVLQAGGKVIFADVNEHTFNIDVNDIERRITSKTKAIVPVHLYGQPVEIQKIRNIADEYSLKVIQDCAQAHGAEINGKPLIHFGDILCFSFYPGKNLGAYGDAGAIVTNDGEIAEFVKMYSNHGRFEKYFHVIDGCNSRMDSIQGAILNIKLKYLNKWTEKRIRIANSYNNLLKDFNEVQPPIVKSGYKHVYHLYVIAVKKNRDILQQFLKDKGISTGVHYPIALPFQKVYSRYSYSHDDYPIADKLQNRILSLPIYPELSIKQISYIVDCIKSFYAG
jgi:dTDP-4-amino-4,6-dideoxygalactose transaminase